MNRIPSTPPQVSLPPPVAAEAASPPASPSVPGGEPAARSPSPARAGGAGLQRALLQQLPPSEADKLAALAGILGVKGDQLDALLPGVSWGKHEQNGTYALRPVDDDRGHELHLDGIGTVTEFAAALIEDPHDTSPEAAAARAVHALMTEVAAPRAQALTLGAVQPVCIGNEVFHLQVKNIDAQRACVVLDNGHLLQLVWQAQHRRYVPAADLSPPPASPGADPVHAPATDPVVLLSSMQTPGTGSADFHLADFGLDDPLAMPLFGLAPEEEAFIKQEPEDEAGPSRLDKGKRPASASPPEDASRRKRARKEVALEIDAGAEAWWDAYRNNQEAELPDFAHLEPAKRLLLRAAAISVPSRVAYEQRDWQARRAGRPLPARAIIQAHREACFARHAAQVAGTSSYRNVGPGEAFRQAWDSLPVENRRLFALGQKLSDPKQLSTKANASLRYFENYLQEKQLTVPGVFGNFAVFAREVHEYRQTPRGKHPNEFSAIWSLCKQCYPELPFRKRIAERLRKEGSAFHSIEENKTEMYASAAGHVDTYLARAGYVPEFISEDLEGLKPFLALSRRILAENKGNALLKSCLNLWREEVYPLSLDGLMDAAIEAAPGVSSTSEKWKKTARRLAEYGWHHEMPESEYIRWLCKLDPKSQPFKTVCEWPGVDSGSLNLIITHFRNHPSARGTGASRSLPEVDMSNRTIAASAGAAPHARSGEEADDPAAMSERRRGKMPERPDPGFGEPPGPSSGAAGPSSVLPPPGGPRGGQPSGQGYPDSGTRSGGRLDLPAPNSHLSAAKIRERIGSKLTHDATKKFLMEALDEVEGNPGAGQESALRRIAMELNFLNKVEQKAGAGNNPVEWLKKFVLERRGLTPNEQLARIARELGYVPGTVRAARGVIKTFTGVDLSGGNVGLPGGAR